MTTNQIDTTVMKNKNYIWTKLGIVAFAILATSCFPDDVGDGNGGAGHRRS